MSKGLSGVGQGEYEKDRRLLKRLMAEAEDREKIISALSYKIEGATRIMEHLIEQHRDDAYVTNISLDGRELMLIWLGRSDGPDTARRYGPGTTPSGGTKKAAK